MDEEQLRRIARGGLRRGRDFARKVYRESPLYAGAEDIKLLVESPLFDHEWYCSQIGEHLDRKKAARHYLERDRETGGHPNMLFDPDYFTEKLPRRLREQMGDRDPFLFFLREQLWLQPTHPLFDTVGYTERRQTHDFPGGAIGHYIDRGARNGRRANDWLRFDPEERRFPDVRPWILARRAEWESRQVGLRAWQPDFQQSAPPYVPWPHAGTVSVIVDAGAVADLAERTLESVAAQTGVRTSVIVVDRGLIPSLRDQVERLVPEATVVVGDPDRTAPGAAAAFAVADGDYVAYVAGGDVWETDRLARLVSVATAEGAPLVADVLERSYTPEHRYSVDVPGGAPTQDVPAQLLRNLLSRLLISRFAIEAVGQPRAAVDSAWSYDLVVRLTSSALVRPVAKVGVRRLEGFEHRRPRRDRPQIDSFEVRSWDDVVRNRTFVDWAALAEQEQDPDTVSVIIPTYDDYLLTLGAVHAVMEAGAGSRSLDVIVWDNGSSQHRSAVLDSLAEEYDEVRVLHSPVNHGFALGNNLAVEHALGETVVFLNNDTTALEGWLTPLVDALADPEVLAAQSLLLYPSGSVQSAGVVFPPHGALPYNLLQEYPREDAAAVDSLRFSALTGAALAMRFADVVALQGFDPLFTNGMEDVDLCHRLSALRPGYMRVVTSSVVVHHESKSKGRYARAPLNRLLYLDRWRGRVEPADDAEKWAACGYQVVGHEPPATWSGPQRAHAALTPVIARPPRATVSEGTPRLRWAIKISAPGEPDGQRWGDTHFAQALARALREEGQETVVDYRYEWERASARFDDVTVALRGLARYVPVPDHTINIGWVISHPDAVTRVEAASYDRLVAASVLWAEKMSRHWGLRIDPLLQATDPSLFHPDRALPDSGHPVLFVGTSRNVERPIIHAAVEAGLPLSVYGHDWERFIPHRFIKAQMMSNADLGAAYRSAGVVLNDHWADMREQGFVSNRLFDAVASGARVISDDVPGLRDLFGRSVQIYETPEDLTRLSSMYDPSEVFGDDAYLREEAARIHREHSFATRARQLVEIVMEERKRRHLDG